MSGPNEPRIPAPKGAGSCQTSYYTNQLGIYLQDRIAITNNLKLLAGLRYDLFHQLAIFRQYGFDSNLPDQEFLDGTRHVIYPWNQSQQASNKARGWNLTYQFTVQRTNGFRIVFMANYRRLKYQR